MIKTNRRPIDEVRQDFALRSHIALHYLLSSPPDLVRLVAMACHIETAWQGSLRSLKTPPKALGPARVLMDGLLRRLEQDEALPVLPREDWQILQAGVICADGVCQRIPPAALLNAMAATRAILTEDESELQPHKTAL
ncbi:hypothetical protein QR66_05220 [Chromobacterium piscinae]|nr:hypothetical protein QR66_05220 [Chromobacterium piscinae]